MKKDGNSGRAREEKRHPRTRGWMRDRTIGERVVHALLFFSAIFAVFVIFFILGFLIKEGYPAFERIGFVNMLSGNNWDPVAVPPSYGAFPLIMGTLLVTAGAMLFSIPLGIGSAVFISELAPPKLRMILKTASELLSGIPSIVYGFFGLVVLTDWLRITFDRPSGEAWLAGSIILGIMALPTIVSVSEDAISSVPRSFKEASLAIGATKWQTITRVTVPAALSGITAAVILGIGRAIGETMAVMMVTGNAAILPQPITNVFSPIRTITGTLGIEMGEVSIGSVHYNALFGLAIILFVIVLAVNSVANAILARLNERFKPTAREVRSKFRLPANLKYYLKLTFYLLLGLALLWVLSTWFGIVIALAMATVSIAIYYASKRLSSRAVQWIGYGMIASSMIAVLFLLSIILYYIIVNGAPALSWEFLTQSPRDSGRAGGIGPAIVGSLYLVGGAILFAVPLGVCAGIYLAEYAKEGKVTKIIRAGIDNLNGTPSIVFGLFGFAFFVLYLNMGISMLAGQLTLGLMILPTIIRTTEEAIKSVPRSVREGSLALGATKWQTVRKVVLPPSRPGILTGVVLGIGRAAGETAPIMFTAAVFTQRFLPTSPLQPVMALPNHLFILATSIPGSQHNAYGTALVLLIMVLAIFSMAAVIRLRFKIERRW